MVKNLVQPTLMVPCIDVVKFFSSDEDSNELESVAPEKSTRLFEIRDGQCFDGEFKTDPFFYSIRHIPFSLFLTFHYRTKSYYTKSEDAGNSRKRLIRELLNHVRRDLGWKQKDIEYFGTSERMPLSRRTHTHTLVYIRENQKRNEEIFLRKLIELLPKDLVDFQEPLENKYPECAQPVRKSEEVTSYLTKLRKSTHIKEEHHSAHFVNFVNSYRKHHVTDDHFS